MVTMTVIDVASLRPDAAQVALVAGLLAVVGTATRLPTAAVAGYPAITRTRRAGPRDAEGGEHLDTEVDVVDSRRLGRRTLS